MRDAAAADRKARGRGCGRAKGGRCEHLCGPMRRSRAVHVHSNELNKVVQKGGSVLVPETKPSVKALSKEITTPQARKHDMQ